MNDSDRPETLKERPCICTCNSPMQPLTREITVKELFNIMLLFYMLYFTVLVFQTVVNYLIVDFYVMVFLFSILLLIGYIFYTCPVTEYVQQQQQQH